MVRRPAALVALCAVLGLLVAGCGTGAGGDEGPRTPVLLGALFSRQGAGYAYGPQQEKGARLAVELVNDAGGVDGVPVEIEVRDDRSDPETGASQMAALIRKGAAAVLGPSLEIVARSAHPVADAAHVPALAVSNPADGIVGDCPYRCDWIWRSSLGASSAVRATIDAFVAETRPRRAAVLHGGPKDVLGADEGRIAAAAFHDLGVEVAADVELAADGEPTDLAVQEALAGDPDVLFVGSSFSLLIFDALRRAQAQGFTGAVLGGNPFNSRNTANLLGSSGVGARSGAAWYAGNEFPANESFIAAYRLRWGEDPDQFAAQAFAGVQILVDALRRAGVDDTVADRRVAIQRTLPEVALTTPLGPFRFTPGHDVAQIVWILRIAPGVRHDLVAFCDPDC